uniref:Translation initiation factor eIF2B subunit beta n=1 Tax=Nyssomyia neivai TaxID=330878 RepID=A0A1L8DS19_9DIPT
MPVPEVASMIYDIMTRKIDSSYEITTRSVTVFKNIIAASEWKTADELMKIIRDQGRILMEALPQENVTANMCRRVLKLIREEYDSAQLRTDESQASLSLHKLVTQTSESASVMDYTKPKEGLRGSLLNHLQEIEMEMETTKENLAEQAAEHIHSSELILTLGHSRSVESFLKSAAKRRVFEVVVAECAPACRGHALAASLAKAKIETTIIPDSAIFAMMSRVNKVIIGTHSVLANGGLRAACGSYTVALAAKQFSVPVIVLVPMYKFSPVHLCSYEMDAFNMVGTTEGVIPYKMRDARKVRCYNPVFDYVPPEFVTLFISNLGGNAPSYVYRLLSELYHPEDYTL